IIAAIGMGSASSGRTGVHDVDGPFPCNPPDQPVRPFSVLNVNGDADASVPYCGYDGGNVAQTSVDQTFDYWSSTLNCGPPSPNAAMCTPVPYTPPAAMGKPTNVNAKDAASCSNGTA